MSGTNFYVIEDSDSADEWKDDKSGSRIPATATPHTTPIGNFDEESEETAKSRISEVSERLSAIKNSMVQNEADQVSEDNANAEELKKLLDNLDEDVPQLSVSKADAIKIEPLNIERPVPEDEVERRRCLQEELMKLEPDAPYIRSLLSYGGRVQIPKEFRTRVYCILLNVDPGFLRLIGDSDWTVNTLDVGIPEYAERIVWRFADESCNKVELVEDVMWIIRAVVVLTGNPFHHFLVELSLLLMCKFRMSREVTYSIMVQLFTTHLPEPMDSSAPSTLSQLLSSYSEGRTHKSSSAHQVPQTQPPPSDVSSTPSAPVPVSPGPPPALPPKPKDLPANDKSSSTVVEDEATLKTSQQAPPDSPSSQPHSTSQPISETSVPSVGADDSSSRGRSGSVSSIHSSSMPSHKLLDPETDAILNSAVVFPPALQLPICSLYRGKSAMRLHALMKLFVQFHAPDLFRHFSRIYPNWWFPYMYPIEIDVAEEMDPQIGTQRNFLSQGLVPSCWLLGLFMSPQVKDDVDVWNATIPAGILDTLVVRGNACYTMYLITSMMRIHRQKLLKCSSKAELQETMLVLPWFTEEKDLPELMEQARRIELNTPTSIIYGMCSIYSQSSGPLSPSHATGSPDAFAQRLNTLYDQFNPSKKSRTHDLLVQWRGKETAFEAACLKNYGIAGVLSRDVYYPPFRTIASSPNLHMMNVMNIQPADLLSTFYQSEVQELSPVDDSEETPNAALSVSGACPFHILDLRSDASRMASQLACSLHVEGKLWKQPLLLEGVIRCLDGINGNKRIIVFENGHPDYSDMELETLSACVNIMRDHGYHYVSVVEGGFFAVHEYIRSIGKLEWLIDHDPNVCEVCRFYRLSDYLNYAKEKSAELAVLAAEKTGEIVTRTVETFKILKSSVPGSREKAVNTLKTAGVAGRSLLGKAVNWTKNSTKKVAESVMERGTSHSTSVAVSAPPPPQSSKPSMAPILVAEVEDDEEDLSAVVARSLAEALVRVSPSIVLSLNKYAKSGAFIHECMDLVTSTEITSESPEYVVMLFGSRIVLLKYQDEKKDLAIVVENYDLLKIKKLSQKKGDEQKVTLQIQASEEEDLFIMRARIMKSAEFCQQIQVLLSEISQE